MQAFLFFNHQTSYAIVFIDPPEYNTPDAVVQSGFSQIHKIGKIGIIPDFVFPYICNFLLYLH